MEPMGSILEHHTRSIKYMSFQGFYMGWKPYICISKDLELLTNFHLNTIKGLQALPNTTATAAVYLLLGATPIIAEIHKRQLSLLFSIATCTNTSIRNVAWRQAAIKSENSFFKKIVSILHIYKFPEFRTIMNGRYKKKEWKIIIKRSIRQYWTDQLQNELTGKTTLSLLCHDCLEVGNTHNIWDAVENFVIEVRKATTKARMLTGTYILQSSTQKQV